VQKYRVEFPQIVLIPTYEVEAGDEKSAIELAQEMLDDEAKFVFTNEGFHYAVADIAADLEHHRIPVNVTLLSEEVVQK
jgi:hypothetical protein